MIVTFLKSHQLPLTFMASSFLCFVVFTFSFFYFLKLRYHWHTVCGFFLFCSLIHHWITFNCIKCCTILIHKSHWKGKSCLLGVGSCASLLQGESGFNTDCSCAWLYNITLSPKYSSCNSKNVHIHFEICEFGENITSGRVVLHTHMYVHR